VTHIWGVPFTGKSVAYVIGLQVSDWMSFRLLLLCVLNIQVQVFSLKTLQTDVCRGILIPGHHIPCVHFSPFHDVRLCCVAHCINSDMSVYCALFSRMIQLP